MCVTCDMSNVLRCGAVPGCAHGSVIIPHKKQEKKA